MQERSRSPFRELTVKPLNADFGALVTSELSAERLLGNPHYAQQLFHAWQEHGGLLVMRNLDLTPQQMVAISAFFGEVEDELDESKQMFAVGGESRVMRIGNTRDPSSGEITALNASDPPLPPGGSPQYRPADRKPAWHTDSVYRKDPPIGSLLYCKQTPPEGGATCFANAAAAYEALDAEKKERLRTLECLCSQAHHDAKINRSSPDFPVLTPAQRAASPAQRVAMVLQHPLNQRLALYGMNGGTCKVLPREAKITAEELERFELEAVEHQSVEEEWRSLLPFVTSPKFTVKWEWQVGDLVLWDNRCTLHCATGFDRDRYVREMWRTTLAQDRPDAPALVGAKGG
ncbi:Alpha-ketoglutarate-dependent taurine dioxygenase (2-aminoethanesulfonate dioxygenase) (Sulfate starvation-induced protein 3) (SSI3) [Durusdinium trenchii]|uniref:Alpha-ketoglutarate-dependent taurine dioxygenase (2-aminoethanesulfonate dioxygenase) (Sulfate starvation-induced protein 3) (SSI3) n=2 Tax=Durusdinium trenchii TaxID=1381693 RepID=A0ABP0P1T6_9DINO